MAQATLTIDLAAIRENWRRLAALAGPVETAAVVKADAYGLGASRVAPALMAEGARTFFVALFEEALALRATLGAAPAIYCLGGVEAQEVAAAAAHDIRPALDSVDHVALVRGAGLRCALQLDVGMNRLGLEPAELAGLLDGDGAIDDLGVTLVVGHLACADDPAHPANAAQREVFETMTAHPRLSGIPRSLGATGGALLGPEWRYDMIRPGIGLYGGLPFREARRVVGLTVPVIQIREVARGETVGYGATWTARRRTRVATIGAGYADGLPRSLAGRGRAFHDGRALPFIGRVSMDLITLDATEAPDLRAGDTVELLGDAQGLDALADAAGTIGYEILTSLGTRYARRYEGA